MGRHRQGDVRIPRSPGSDLVVVEPGFVPGLLEALLDPPAGLGDPDRIQQGRAAGSVADVGGDLARSRERAAGETGCSAIRCPVLAYSSSPRLPNPHRLAVPARPGVVRAASRPPRHLPGQTALSFTALLRQDGGGGLSPPLESTAPHGAQGWYPNPPLKCGDACSFSEWTSTSVASRSSTT